MKLLIELILLTSIWVLGLTIITQPGMILSSVREWAEKKKSILLEPIILCEWCMSSIHSSVGYGFAILIGIIKFFSWKLVFIYPLVAMGSSCVCGILWQMYLTTAFISEYFKNKCIWQQSKLHQEEVEEVSLNQPPL